MKKLFLTLALTIMCTAASFAQKGTSAVGINLGYTIGLNDGTKVNNFGLGAKYQYNFTDAFRGELEFTYDFKDKGLSFMNYGVNLHYLINCSESFKVYPIVGLGAATAKLSVDGFYDDEDDEYYDGGSASKTHFSFNVGVGGEYLVSEHIGVSLEVKYQYIKDFSRLPIRLGVAYKF